ncbi:uncharacterized protein BDV14DRAFT_200417 [Aspergillus stella-maris]|uniref:uncharacterized protein n=1 Tax=Aspergillus stella-maris TaxID=1810926 RepID=UPI003CCD7C58
MHPIFTNPIVLLALTIFSEIQIATAQIGYDAKTNHFLCPSPEARFCAARSLQGSSLIACTPNGKAEILSCDFELSHILPVGYEEAAVYGFPFSSTCLVFSLTLEYPGYESVPNAGDAICAFNGTGYTPDGVEVDVPETTLCNEAHLFPMGLSVRNDNDVLYNPSLQPLLSTPGLGLGLWISATAVPSTSQYHANGRKESASVLICSNPWATNSATGAVPNMADEDSENLTLNIILVIPTSASAPITTHAIPEPGAPLLSLFPCLSFAPLASSVLISQPCPTSPRSSLVSTTWTTLADLSLSTIIPAPETLTLYGTPLAGPVGGDESVVPNGAGYHYVEGRDLTAGFAVLVWALVLFGFF